MALASIYLKNSERPIYKTVKVVNTSKDLKDLLSMNSPAWVKSWTPISEIIPVVRKRKINCPTKDGYIPAIAWGRTILKNITFLDKPIDIAPSSCPLLIFTKPALNISAKYAEKFRTSARSACAQKDHW